MNLNAVRKYTDKEFKYMIKINEKIAETCKTISLPITVRNEAITLTHIATEINFQMN